MTSTDKILADLSQRFINRKVFKSITFSQDNQDQLEIMRNFVEEIGFGPLTITQPFIRISTFHTIFIGPESENPRTQIEIVQRNGELAELSSPSPIVQSLAGSRHGDQPFLLPKEMAKAKQYFH